jgi:hypothetical protein
LPEKADQRRTATDVEEVAFLAAVERIISSIEIQHDLGASVKDGNKHGGT